MRPTPRLVGLVAGLSVLGAAPVAPVAGQVGADAPAPGERFGPRVPFSARVEVRWVDAAGLHTVEVGVRAAGGVVRIEGDPDVVAGSGDGLVLHDAGLGLVAPPAAATGPGDGGRLAGKYDLRRQAGPVVAGRPTTLVLLRSGGLLRERLAIDDVSGLVLRRELFGHDGRAVRVVEVLELQTPVAAGPPPPGVRPSSLRPVPLPAVPDAYRAPQTLAGGYRRVGAYRHDRMFQLLYTDGLHGLSLFTQRGDLSGWPGGGRAVAVGSRHGVHYTWPGGEVVAWETGSVVRTLVGDAPVDELLAAAGSVPRPGRPSILSRVRSTCRRVAELVSGGR